MWNSNTYRWVNAKKGVTLLLTCWGYIFPALTHQYFCFIWLYNLLYCAGPGPFSVSCSREAQTMLSQSQARSLKWPALWLAEHSLSLHRARDRKQVQVIVVPLPLLYAIITMLYRPCHHGASIHYLFLVDWLIFPWRLIPVYTMSGP